MVEEERGTKLIKGEIKPGTVVEFKDSYHTFLAIVLGRAEACRMRGACFKGCEGYQYVCLIVSRNKLFRIFETYVFCLEYNPWVSEVEVDN